VDEAELVDAMRAANSTASFTSVKGTFSAPTFRRQITSQHEHLNHRPV